jgi:hypothetical protein
MSEAVEIVDYKVTKTFETLVVQYPYWKDGKTENVSVYCDINYSLGKFNILNSNKNKEFKFAESSHLSPMWLATLEAMKIAIKQAENLLIIHNESIKK